MIRPRVATKQEMKPWLYAPKIQMEEREEYGENPFKLARKPFAAVTASNNTFSS